MAFVLVGENESLESALKRFKKQLEREGVMKEFRKREFFEKPSFIEHTHVREVRHKHRGKLLKSRRRKPSYGRDERERGEPEARKFDKEERR